ncbi:MAG TPA: glycerol kinase GlpK [Acidimicrobiales bacterium]|nr:glycerol kinase GlpK [Acidimicrobiales bacterium]
MGCLIAIDAGTTGVRALAVDEAGAVIDVSYREIGQHFPRPGWVEHDAAEIWSAVAATVDEVARRRQAEGQTVAGIGITNQRETVVAWDRSIGEPRHRAIVWQDRRTAGRCDELQAAGHLDFVRAHTGLVLDPYFSATKMAWLLTEGGVTADADLVLGTVDSWVIWNLTGGPEGGALVTDPSNASRTLLYDIVDRRWSEELAELFGVPLATLPELRPSCGRFGLVAGSLAGAGSPLAGVPVSGVAGDQQAALFGQACFDPGLAKATYGTGSFVLLNVGEACPPPSEGLLTTVAWDLGDHGGSSPVAYALEGAVFVTGAAVQWLRDGLGLIATSAEIGPLAGSVASTEGVYLVPAFTGLGSPFWDPYARGAITGLTRGVGAAHIARAVVEAMAFQVRDVVDAMTAVGGPLAGLRVDGGASVMDLLLQLQADQIRVPVERPATAETTALGAAFLAGLAEGVWGSLEELSSLWKLERSFDPVGSAVAADTAHTGWRAAVQRSLGWAPNESGP